MAIAFDNKSNGSGASPVTISHTVNSNTNGLLIVFVDVGDGGTDPVTGVTYNSVSMTQGYKTLMDGSTWGYAYYLFAPATGAHNIVISSSAGNPIGFGLSYTGVKQSGFPDATNVKIPASPPTTTLTGAITTVADNSWVACMLHASNAGITASTNVTLRLIDGGTAQASGDSGGAVTPAGSFSQTWTYTNSNNASMIQVSFAPSLPVDLTNMWHPLIEQPYPDKYGIVNY